MRAVPWGITIAAGLAGAAIAQDSAQETGLPPITVRPSGIIDESAEIRARQVRLMDRLQQSDDALRHICTNCMGPGAPRGTTGLFYPLQALRREPKTPSPPQAAE